MAQVLEILQQARQIEKDGEEYYHQAAEQSSHPVAKHTFVSLAEQEKLHAKYFETFYEVMTQERSWPPRGTVELEEFTVCEMARDIFQQARAELAAGVPPSADLHELYAEAMEIERKSIAFYHQQAQEVADDSQKEFFEFLVEQEKGHLELLANTQKFLDDPAHWYFDEEHWIVEG